jgi:hypothetical protein
MPYSDPHPSDPHSLVGVEVPAGQEVHLDMAYVIAEEFARLGFDEQHLLRLFQNPFYRSAHQAFKILGEEKIKSIIQEALGVWGRNRFVEHQAEEPLVQLEGLSRDERKR